MKKTKKILMVLVISIQMIGIPSFAQSEDAPPPSGTRRQMATIVFSGLAGAVLGLSTLSFYGRPQDRLSNIAIGFAIGIITGSVLVTYGATTNPDEFYGRDAYYYIPDGKLISSAELDFERTKNYRQAKQVDIPLYNYSF